MVIWDGPGAQWDDAGLAVPCPTCNAEIGKVCVTRVFRLPRAVLTHLARQERAEAFGFRIALATVRLGKAPPKPPAPAHTLPLFDGIAG